MKAHVWRRAACTFMLQTDHPEKVLILERRELVETTGEVMRKRDPGGVEYRIGYFIVGNNVRTKGRWAWGQYCPLIPAQDFWELIGRAMEECTLVGTLPTRKRDT